MAGKSTKNKAMDFGKKLGVTAGVTIGIITLDKAFGVSDRIAAKVQQKTGGTTTKKQGGQA